MYLPRSNLNFALCHCRCCHCCAGRYLEIFARKNNLRSYWVSIGNEVTGTGLPEEDLRAFKHSNSIPGAVYGRGSGGTSAAAGGTAAAAAAGK